MKVLPLAALVAAAMLSALIVLDIVWNANNPDQVGPWLDAGGHPYLLPITGATGKAAAMAMPGHVGACRPMA